MLFNLLTEVIVELDNFINTTFFPEPKVALRKDQGFLLRDHSITTWTRGGGEGFSGKSTLGHVTKDRYHVKCPQLSTRGGVGGRN